ncbi:hypothetical protein AhyVDH1_003 [Aeromonas phage AhyVDH1]|nr:hypothetical protein AhyVDH1_003 [Aeromonas phage AhyVDH1]
MNMKNLDHQQCSILLGFAEENWEQFVAHVAGHNGITEEEAEAEAEDIVEALGEGANG